MNALKAKRFACAPVRLMVNALMGFLLLPLPVCADAPASSVSAAPTASNVITISADSQPRQTFAGLGASLFPWTPSAVYNAQVSSAQTLLMARMLWRDAGFRSVRLWIHPGEEPLDYYVDGYVRTGKLPAAIAAGAKDLILAPDHIPPAMGDGHGYIRDTKIPRYAALLADFIHDFKAKTGIAINYCGVLNEPNDRPIKFTNAQWPVMIKALRQALDARGLRFVGVVAPESANCGADAYAVVDSIKANREAWRDLAGVATHSYNNAATREMAARSVGKQYWITEAGGMTDSDEGPGDAVQAASVAARFLNDVNHGVTHWQFFIGAEQSDPNGNTGRILKYDVAPLPFRLTALQKYSYLKQISEAFAVGARFRHTESSLDGEMSYGYSPAPGRKPHLNAAVARNTDGSWAVGLTNFTSDYFGSSAAPDWIRQQGGAPAQTFSVTIRIPELTQAKPLRFAVHRSNKGRDDAADGTVVMTNGVVTVPAIAPLDLVTLRSLAKQ